MKKRNFILITFLTLSLMFTGLGVSFAADPSGLVVVRASDNSLWKATCVGTTCTSFTSFPGMFGSQPTVYWDENIQRYVLWGRASDGSIWRSTFDRLGNFNNDWASVPGSTASPPGAAGGGIAHNVWYVNPDGLTDSLNTTTTNIMNDFVVCPWDGYVFATASGFVQITHTVNSGLDFGVVDLAETSGTENVNSFTVGQIPTGAPSGLYAFPFSITRVFACPSGGGGKTVYVTGRAAQSGNTSSDNVGLYLQYQPYRY